MFVDFFAAGYGAASQAVYQLFLADGAGGEFGAD